MAPSHLSTVERQHELELLADRTLGQCSHVSWGACWTAPANPEDDGTTIYVGMTSNLPLRLRAHSRKWWWPMVAPDRSEFMPVPTRKFAAELEALTIHNEQPAMNRAGRVLVPRFVEVPR